MGSKKLLKARLLAAERTDALRRFEVAGCDAELLKADERLRKAKAFALALCDRILRAHEILALRAEKRAVTLSERDYCPL